MCISYSLSEAQEVYKYSMDVKAPGIDKKNRSMYEGCMDYYLVKKDTLYIWIECDAGYDCITNMPFYYNKTDSSIIFNYYDKSRDKWRAHLQFSFKDTVDYMTEDNLDIRGQSFYIGDTLLVVGDDRFPCYYFKVFDQGTSRSPAVYRDIFIAKEELRIIRQIVKSIRRDSIYFLLQLDYRKKVKGRKIIEELDLDERIKWHQELEKR